MKKKTRFKLNSSLFTFSEKFTYWLFNCICVIGVLINLWLFYESYTMTLKNQGGRQIATITFKYKTAQRRFEEGTIWDRLQQESPVYNGDTIRTADMSEATLHFIDGNKMNLTDNTMTQVFLNEDKQLKALLSGGSITIDTTDAQEGSKGLELSYNGVEIELEAGTTLNASGNAEKDFAVQVFNGNATVTKADGSTTSMAEGDVLSITESGAPKASIAITKPLPNAKVINHSKNAMNIPIEWKVTGIDAKLKYTVDIATDSGFKNIEQTIYAEDKTSIAASISNGQKFYRVNCYDADNQELVNIKGKINVIESLVPRQIAPVTDYQFRYRKQLPAVRFLWSESKYATSYELVIADNANFRNPIIVQRTALPSSIISSLSNGKWYWRVTPFYTINNLGLDGTSDTGSFEIIQQGKLSVPALLSPQEGSFVNTKNASRNTTFSWRLDRESVQYNLIIADNPELKNPKVSRTTDVNYYSVDISKENFRNGNWYWSVCGIDTEGNKSDYSEPRSFYAIDGEVIQRTVYPPDQYSSSQNLINDIRFTWKSNLPYDKKFEIAKDPDFNQVVFKQYVHDSTISGINLAIGTYYWRIVSSAPDRDFYSPVKTLYVAGPLDAPVCIAPEVSRRALVRPFTPYDFTWTAVDGANYYKLTIKNPRTDEILFEKNLIEANKYSVNLEALPEGFYMWTIQGFSYETELSSRRTGKIGEAKFEMKKIHPVELVSPAENTVMNGVDAILTPTTTNWVSKDEISKWEYVLTRTDVKPAEVVARIKNPERTFRLPRLHSGSYTWTVNAESIDGFDLSPAEPRHFTVTPVPPLPDVTKLEPANRTKFDAAYFKSTKQINFSWAPVKNATHYIIKVKKRDGTVLLEQKTKATKAEFKDITKLEKGTFTWTVEAQRCIEDGTALQESAPAKSTFIVDLPTLKATKLKDGLMYGK